MNRTSEGPAAQALFTGRLPYIRRFLEDLHADVPPNRILFLEGEAGLGKTLLLRQLRSRYCKRFTAEDWSFIREQEDTTFAEHAARGEGVRSTAAALIDLADPAPDGLAILLRLRDQLLDPQDHRIRLRFPRFHYGHLRLLRLENRLTPEAVKEIVPASEAGLALEAIELLSDSHIPFLSGIIRQVNKQGSVKVRQWRERLRLGEEDGRTIDGFSSPRELRNALPGLFGKDLVDSLLAMPDARVVLLFDSYDALAGGRIDAPDQELFGRDEWFRLLMNEIQPPAGLVVWVAGRRVPPWTRAPRERIPPERVEVAPLIGLTPDDASAYLLSLRALHDGDAADPAVEQAIVAYASIAPGEIHPQLLGLCGDLLHQSRRAGTWLSPEAFAGTPGLEQRRQELLNRVLDRVDQRLKLTVYALAASRSFDRELYTAVGRELDLGPSRVDFELLAGLSFVRLVQDRRALPAPGERGRRFAIHELVRRMLRENGEPITLEAHQALERHFRSLTPADRRAAVEAIYHASHLDPDRATDEWLDEVTSAGNLGELARLEAFLSLQPDLPSVGDYRDGRVLTATGVALEVLGRPAAAIELYDRALVHFGRSLHDREAEAAFQTGFTLLRRGNAQVEIGALTAAEATFTRALEAFEAVDDPARVQDHSALTLLGRARLEVEANRLADANRSFEAAFAAFHDALAAAPGNADILANYGSGLLSRASLAVRVSDISGARVLLELAIGSFNLASHFAPDRDQVANNLALSLLSLSQLEAANGAHAEARERVTRAVATLAEHLSSDRPHPVLLETLGLALHQLAIVEAEDGETEEVRLHIDQAIGAFERALEIAPLSVTGHVNRGAAFNTRGNFASRAGDRAGAIASLREALASFEAALELAPGHETAAANLAQVTMTLLFLEGSREP